MKKIMTFAVAALLAIGLTFGPVYADVNGDQNVGGDQNIVNEDTVDTQAQSNSNAGVVQNYGDSISTRQIPGVIAHPGWVNPQYHNAPRTRTWNILQFVDLAKIRRVWNREQLETILSNAPGDTGDVTPIPYNAVPAVTPKNERTKRDAIGIVFSTTVPDGYHDTGVIQVEEPDGDVNGFKMAAQYLLDAMNMGGSVLMITVEDAEIQQYTKARSFFIGGGMSAIAGDGPSGAHGGGAVSGIGAGSIRSGKQLAPHATAVVLEANDDCVEVLDSGKVRCATDEEIAAYDAAKSLLTSLSDLDEEGQGPKPTVATAKDGNGKLMKKYFIESQNQ